jgi:predicted regulator of Ras-like GTPase activity (Roadblock/LC7/MglB family)
MVRLMPVFNSAPDKGPAGFGGEIAGFSLADVLQLNIQNRFSGCISVESEDGTGRIFLRDAEIVHAEAAGHTGEEAFCEILSWAEGRFSLQSNVAAARTTIQKGWRHLMLDAYRIIDERRAGKGPPAPAAKAGRPTTSYNVLAELKRIPGVSDAVVERTDGERVEHENYQAEVLAGHAQYLAVVAAQLGAAFSAGELLGVTLQATTQHVVMLRGRNRVLSAQVAADHDAGAVEADIRKLLGMSR